jgi:hypothetical protein
VIRYFARAVYRIRSSKLALLRATIGDKYYIDLPQMYTTSIVHKSVLEKGKSRNKGFFYNIFPPDANGAASICLVEDRYLESLIPISWVGSSPKSFPVAYTQNKEQTIAVRKQEFRRSNSKWPAMAGRLYDECWNLTIVDNFKLYLFAALLSTGHLQTIFQKAFYNSRLFKLMLFANLYHDITDPLSEQLKYLKDLCDINNIKYKNVVSFHDKFLKLLHKMFQLLEKINNKIRRIGRSETLSLYKDYPLEPVPRLIDAYNWIKELDIQNNFIKHFISKRR